MLHQITNGEVSDKLSPKSWRYCFLKKVTSKVVLDGERITLVLVKAKNRWWLLNTSCYWTDCCGSSGSPRVGRIWKHSSTKNNAVRAKGLVLTWMVGKSIELVPCQNCRAICLFTLYTVSLLDNLKEWKQSSFFRSIALLIPSHPCISTRFGWMSQSTTVAKDCITALMKTVNPKNSKTNRRINHPAKFSQV